MAANTQLNPGSAGDLIRTIDRSGSGPKTQVLQLDVGGGGATESLVSSTNPLPITKAFGTRADTYTVTSTNGTAVDVTSRPCIQFSLQVKGTGAAATVWDVVLEGSLNGTNYYEILRHASTGNPLGNQADGAVVTGQTAGGFLYFRSRTQNTLTLGSATNIVATIVGMQ